MFELDQDTLALWRLNKETSSGIIPEEPQDFPLVLLALDEAAGATSFANSGTAGGEWTGSNVIAGAAPQIGSASADFGDGNTKRSIYGGRDVEPAAITVASWVKLRGYPNNYDDQIVHKEYHSDSGWGGPWISVALDIIPSGIIRAKIISASGVVTSAIAAEPFPLGVWCHLGMTFNPTDNKICLYLDGILSSEAWAPGSIYYGTHGYWRLGGALRGGDPQTINGFLDNVRIYDEVKSAEWFAAFSTFPGVIPDQQTVSLWRFDESAGISQVMDEVGANNIVLTGMPQSKKGVVNGSRFFDSHQYGTCLASQAAIAAAKGDWTVEGWLKMPIDLLTAYALPRGGSLLSLEATGMHSWPFRKYLTIAIDTTVEGDRFFRVEWTTAESPNQLIQSQKRDLPLGEWFHFAVRSVMAVDKTRTISIFVNGERVDHFMGQPALTCTDSAPVWHLTTYKDLVYDNLRYVGGIDDLHYSKTGRSDEYIKANYLRGLLYVPSEAVLDETQCYPLQDMGGTTLITDVQGHKARSFNGTTPAYLVGDTDESAIQAMRDGEWTIEVWGRATAVVSGYPAVLALAGLTGDNGIAENYLVEFNATVGSLHTLWEDATEANVTAVVPWSAIIKDQWAHWAITRTNNPNTCTLRFYLNGILIHTAANLTKPAGGDNARWYLGADGTSSGRFSGELREIKISTRVRTAAELRATALQLFRLENPLDDSVPTEHPIDEYTLSLWRMNEAAASDAAVDACGRHNLAPVANPKVVQGIGRGARNFDGTQHFVGSLPDDAVRLACLGELTTEMWVRPLTVNALAALFTWGGPLAGSEAPEQNYIFRHGYNANGPQRAFWEYGSGTNADAVQDAGLNVTPGEWQHLACVRRPSLTGWAVDFYRNGAIMASREPYSAPTDGSAAVFYIGRNGPNNDSYLNGDLDDLRLSNVARTPEEIQASYLRGNVEVLPEAPPEGPFPIQLHFDDPPGSTTVVNSGTAGGTWAVSNSPQLGVLGKTGTAIDFIGDQVRRRITSGNGIVEPMAFTVWCWVNIRRQLTYNTHIIHKCYRNDGTWLDPYQTATIELPSSANPGQILYAIKRVGQAKDSLSTAAGVLRLGVWSHLALTYDGTYARGYCDGRKVCEQYVPGVPDYGTHGPWQSGDPNPYGNIDPTDGLVDEITVVDYALTPGQILGLYQSFDPPEEYFIPCDFYEPEGLQAIPLLKTGWVSEAGDCLWLQYDQALETPNPEGFRVEGLQILAPVSQPKPGLLRVPVTEMKVKPYRLWIKEGITSASGGRILADVTLDFIGVPLQSAGKRNMETPHWLSPRIFYPQGAWRTGGSRSTRKTF